jgi:hypothetical protein
MRAPKNGRGEEKGHKRWPQEARETAPKEDAGGPGKGLQRELRGSRERERNAARKMGASMKFPGGPEFGHTGAWEPTKKALYRSLRKSPIRGPTEACKGLQSKGSPGAPRKGKNRNGERKTKSKNRGPKEGPWEPGNGPGKGPEKGPQEAWKIGGPRKGSQRNGKRGMAKGRRNQIMGAPIKAPGCQVRGPMEAWEQT